MPNNNPATDEARLLAAAIGGGKASISDMLRCVAELMNSFGCVLWQAEPDSKLDATPPEGALFVLASWFPEDDIFAMHDLRLESATGQTILSKQTYAEKDLFDSGGKTDALTFFRRHELKPMCTAAVRFYDGQPGALNVYRKDGEIQFSSEDEERLKNLAELIPTVYACIRDRESLKLVRAIDQIFHNARVEFPQGTQTGVQIRETLEEVCLRIADTFHSLEVSLVLEDRLNAPGKFEVQACSWKEGIEQNCYEAKVGDGITGWILFHKKPVNLFDLLEIKDPFKLHAIQRRYPEICWSHSATFPDSVKKKLGLPDGSPPLSFMGVPILSGSTLLGALRCCTAKREPYYYSEHERKMLQLVTPLIGRFWESWQEIKTWEQVADDLNELNELTRKELASISPNRRVVLNAAVALPGKLIKGTQANGIRLKDRAKNELYYEAWDEKWPRQIPPDRIPEIRKRRFPIDPAKSTGAVVTTEGQITTVFYPQSQRPTGWFEEMGVKASIHAPIKVGAEIFGTLDIRNWEERGFPRHARSFAELLGGQIGLYLDLLDSVVRIRDAESDSEKTRQETTRRFQDLAHQLRGPIIQLRKRAQLAVEGRSGEVEQNAAFVIRGLSRKSWQSAMSMKALAEIHQGSRVTTKRSRITFEWIMKTLIEACMDHKAMTDPDRSIRHNVDEASFQLLRTHDVQADKDLLEQMVGNLIDNAFKYSFSNTLVKVSGGTTGKGRFYVSVTSVGLKLRSQETHLCKQRGWRSDHAQWTTGEGSGIGLWLVEHIMTAHDGDLVVIATDENNLTDIRLVFPISR